MLHYTNHKMQTIVFLGSKPIGYHCLLFLLKNNTTLNSKVIAVATNHKNNLEQAKESVGSLARQYQIPLINTLNSLPTCDFIISVQYHKVLREKHIAKANKLAINLHMAPLPEYRGCNQFSFAILDQKTTFGTSLHRLEAGIDSGAIIAEKRFAIPSNCWVKTLYRLTCQASKQLFEEEIGNILLGNYQLKPQKELLDSRGSSYHYRHEINAIKQVDLSWPKEKIERYIRATYFPPFEPPYCIVDGKKVYFTVEQ